MFPLCVDVSCTSRAVCGLYFVRFPSRSKFISVPTHSSLMNVESPGGFCHAGDLNLLSLGSKVNCQVVCLHETSVIDCCCTKARSFWKFCCL